VPPGFTVERLYSVPLAAQGSWVSLAVDPRGALYASDQYGALYRIHVPALGAPGAARVERLPIALGEAHGLLWAFDSLYVVVSAAGEHASGLYRASDTDGDGELDHVDLLSAFDGDGEHGPHAVVLDADGQSLLVIAGNFTKLPSPLAHLRRPHNWAEDTLLPVIGDPNGHAVDIRAPGGWVARTDRDGRAWELVAAGMRNSYDVALSPDGELFTYDSDMEWDIGLPWYKPTRVLHLVSGGEFGWRTGSGNWPADALDALPGAAELGIGSPTGIVFGTATRFPEPWNRALFACDWAYGRVFAVHLEPRGASYRGTHEVFASGQPFPVTDVVVGPDGALYLTTGGRRTQSGLYRIAWTGAVAAAAPIPVEPAVLEARAARHRLEALHAEDAPASDAEALDFAWPFLGDDDQFLRAAARVVLEHRPVDAWRERALAETDPRSSLEALLALVHGDASTPASAVLARAAQVFAAHEDHELRSTRCGCARWRSARLAVGEGERTALRTVLDPAYPSGDARLDRALLPLLVFLDADVAERALRALDAATTQEQRIDVLYSLRVLASGWTAARTEHVLAAFRRELASAAGGASVHGYVRAICDELCQRLGVTPPADEPAEPRQSGASSRARRARARGRWPISSPRSLASPILARSSAARPPTLPRAASNVTASRARARTLARTSPARAVATLRATSCSRSSSPRARSLTSGATRSSGTTSACSPWGVWSARPATRSS
jgi:glucose/arabinose dehydrogenase